MSPKLTSKQIKQDSKLILVGVAVPTSAFVAGVEGVWRLRAGPAHAVARPHRLQRAPRHLPAPRLTQRLHGLAHPPPAPPTHHLPQNSPSRNYYTLSDHLQQLLRPILRLPRQYWTQDIPKPRLFTLSFYDDLACARNGIFGLECSLFYSVSSVCRRNALYRL